MSYTFWLWFSAIVPVGPAIWLGFALGKHKPPSEETIRKYLNRVVALEEFEERDKINKLRMTRNKRKTYRVDGGPNARMMRIRVTPKKRRRR